MGSIMSFLTPEKLFHWGSSKTQSGRAGVLGFPLSQGCRASAVSFFAQKFFCLQKAKCSLNSYPK